METSNGSPEALRRAIPPLQRFAESHKAFSESSIAPPHGHNASTEAHLQTSWIYVVPPGHPFAPPEDLLAPPKESDKPSRPLLRAPSPYDDSLQRTDMPPRGAIAPFKTQDASPKTYDAPLKTYDESFEVYIVTFPPSDGAPRARLAPFRAPVEPSSWHPGLPIGKRASLEPSQPKMKALRRKLDMRSSLIPLLSLALAAVLLPAGAVQKPTFQLAVFFEGEYALCIIAPCEPIPSPINHQITNMLCSCDVKKGRTPQRRCATARF
jgi:hypothetical protein